MADKARSGGASLGPPPSDVKSFAMAVFGILGIPQAVGSYLCQLSLIISSDSHNYTEYVGVIVTLVIFMSILRSLLEMSFGDFSRGGRAVGDALTSLCGY